MSWEGVVVNVSEKEQRVSVCRGKHTTEQFFCLNPERPRLSWMIGETFWAGCYGSTLIVGGIEVGKRVGNVTFKLRTPEAAS